LEIDLQEKLNKSEKRYATQKILGSITEIQASYIKHIFGKNNKPSNINCALQVALKKLIKLSKSKLGFVGESIYNGEKLVFHHLSEGNFLSIEEKTNSEKNAILKVIFNFFTEDILSTKKTANYQRYQKLF